MNCLAGSNLENVLWMNNFKLTSDERKTNIIWIKMVLEKIEVKTKGAS